MDFSKRTYRQFIVTIKTNDECTEKEFTELAKKTKEFIKENKNKDTMGEIEVRVNY